MKDKLRETLNDVFFQKQSFTNPMKKFDLKCKEAINRSKKAKNMKQREADTTIGLQNNILERKREKILKENHLILVSEQY